MPRNDLTRKIYEIMDREMQDIGPFIVRKQCLLIHVDPENVEPANLPQLAAKLSEVMVLFGGHEKARKIYSELRKLKDLDLIVKEETSEGTKLKMKEELGKGSLFAGEWDKASGYFEQLLADADARKDAHARTRYLKWLGMVHQERAEFDLALKRYETALAVAKNNGDKTELASCHNSIGDVLWYKGEHAKAIEAYRLAASNAESAGFQAGVGTAYIGIGNVQADRYELADSIDSYKTALENLKYTEEFQQISRAHNNLGDTFRQMKNWDEALKSFGKSEEFGERAGWLNMVAWSRFNSAMVLVEKGALKEAEALLVQSEATLEQIGDRAGLAGAKHAWGKLHAAQGKTAQMERSYGDAISLYKSMKTPFSEAECHYELGMAYKKIGSRDKALERLRTAAVMYTDLKLDKWAKIAVKEIESMG